MDKEVQKLPASVRDDKEEVAGEETRLSVLNKANKEAPTYNMVTRTDRNQTDIGDNSAEADEDELRDDT